MSSHSSNSLKSLDRHKDYYIKGGDLYFVVSHTLFRVHSYFFIRESEKFREIMAVPAALGQLRQGETDTTAIMIKDVSVDIFAKFLWVFYNPVYVDYTATLPEWLGILKLAHEYEFSEVKRLAIEELGSLEIPIAERIALYQTHAVDPAYLVPLYVKMCMRDEGPTDDETTTMGMKTSVIIFRARERLRFRPLAGGKPQGTVSFPQTDENDITRTIYSLLGFDFNGQISVSRRKPTTGVATTRMRRVVLRRSSDPPAIRETSSFRDQAQNVEVIQENGGMLCDSTEKNFIVAQENSGYLEISEKDSLMVVAGRQVVSTTTSRYLSVAVNSTHGTGSAVAIFMVIPARTFLFIFAFVWTFLLFWVIREFPSHLRIL